MLLHKSQDAEFAKLAATEMRTSTQHQCADYKYFIRQQTLQAHVDSKTDGSVERSLGDSDTNPGSKGNSSQLEMLAH